MKKRGKLFVSCSGGNHLTKEIAKKAKGKYSELETERFPDSELRIRITESVKGKKVYFVQSFYKEKNDINDKLVEVLFAAETALELGAKKVYLIAPYLAYLREDARFRKGEVISAKILSRMCKIFKKVYVVEPHLHRFKSFDNFFKNAVRVSLAEEVSEYIKKKIGDCLLIGPDKESEQWVGPVAKKLGLEYKILSKTRYSSRKVKTQGKKSKAKKIVIIDDIISTGGTLVEASKLIKADKIYFVAAHGLFSENALKKLKKYGKTIVSNTIPSKASKLNCVDAIVRKL